MIVVMMVFMFMLMFVLVLTRVRFGLGDNLVQHIGGQRVAVLHDGEKLCAGQLIPRGGDDAGARVVLAQQVNDLRQTVFLDELGAGE